MDIANELAERLAPLGGVVVRSMFGGQGLFLEGRMFALVAQSTPYFKVDDETREDFVQAGAEPFTYGKPKPGKGKSQLGYYEVPASVLENDGKLVEWGTRAVRVAERAAAKRPARRKGPARTLRGMRGLGKVSTAWLVEAGIETPAQLEALGSVAAFLRVRAQRPRVSKNLLYALEGALLDLHWAKLPADLKRRLCAAVDAH